MKPITGILLSSVMCGLGVFAGAEISNYQNEKKQSEIIEAKNDQIRILAEQVSKLQEQLKETGRDEAKIYLDSYISGQALSVTTFASGETFVTYGSSDMLGLYKLSSDTSLEQIFADGYSWDIIHKTANGKFLFASSKISKGIVLHNSTSGETKQIFSSGAILDNFYELSNGDVVISSSQQTQTGILFYSETEETVEKLYASGYNWRNCLELSNGNVLINSSTSDTLGVLLYDKETKAITKIDSEQYGLNYGYETSSGNAVLTSSFISKSGIYLYNSQDNTISKGYDGGFDWKFFIELSNGNLLISSTSKQGTASSGIVLFNQQDNSFTKIYTIAKYWSVGYELDNGDCLLSSSYGTGGYGLLLYKASDNTVTKIYSGNYWDTFVEEENGVTISSSKNAGQGSIYYDFATGVVTAIIEGESV